MSYSNFRTGIAVGLLLTSTLAEAQIAPGGGMPGGMGQTPAQGEEKKEGVAEAAPKSPGLLPTNPVLPGAEGASQALEADRYRRLLPPSHRLVQELPSRLPR
jgi:hypothetical protein